MRWWIGLLPLVATAQTITITIADTMPALFHRWQDSSWHVTVSASTPIVLRMLARIEGDNHRLCMPFAAAPVMIAGGIVRFPVSAILAELLLNVEPLYRHNRLPAGHYRLCVDLVAPNDSLRLVAQQCRRFVVVGIPRLELFVESPYLQRSDTAMVVCVWRSPEPISEDVALELRIVEQVTGQSSWHALMTSVSIATCQQPARGRTQWECRFPPTIFTAGKKYACGVVVHHGMQMELVSPVVEFQPE